MRECVKARVLVEAAHVRGAALLAGCTRLLGEVPLILVCIHAVVDGPLEMIFIYSEPSAEQ